MSPLSLPYLCLREIFEFALHSKSGLLFSCILVCKYWSELAIPILWRDPLYNLYNHQRITQLLDIYLFNFTLKELKNLNLPSNLIEDYNNNKTCLKYNYIKFLRRLNLTRIRTATSIWLRNKKFENKKFENIIIKDNQIFQSFCKHFIKNSNNIKYIEFEPGYDSLFDFNLFELPGAEINLSNLIEFSCYGEPNNINLYEKASKISTKIQDLKIILLNGCPINPTTLFDISNFITSQKQIKEFLIDNRIGCDCCPHDLSLSLDLTIIFKSLNTQTTTLSHINFFSIDFHKKFPIDQLLKCDNLKELNIKGCWNFGEINLIELNYNNDNSFKNLTDLQIIKSSIPEELIKILLIQSGKSLKNLNIEIEEIIIEILKYCIGNNPNLVNILIYIDSKEIQYLPEFLRSSSKLCKLEIWDKNTIRKEMDLVNMINLDDELFADIGDSLPNKLKDLTISMKWNFSIKSFERFIKNCKAPLDVLGFEFCECFDNEYFEILVKNLKRPLKKLNIGYCRARLNSEIRKKNEDLIQQIDSIFRYEDLETWGLGNLGT